MGSRSIRYSLPGSNGRPTHDRVDAPNAGYCVAAHCHPNAIGLSENRRPASNVKHGPTLNRCRSCVWHGS